MSDKKKRAASAPDAVVAHGWTILAHPLFLDQVNRLTAAAEADTKPRASRRDSDQVNPNTRLLGHLIDLAFDKIPRDPGNPAYRQGTTLGRDRTHWFRGKTGNGRYRLFYRYHSAARIIIYAWVNDAQTLRKTGSRPDAYAVFGRMLGHGNPLDNWDALLAAGQDGSTVTTAVRVMLTDLT